MVIVHSIVRVVSVVALLVTVGCVEATNPFDPGAPASVQAPATIVGRIRLVDTTAPSPDALDGEVAGLRITLLQDRDVAVDTDGVAHDVGVDEVVDGAGAFTLRNVVPGVYNLRIDNVGSRFDDDRPVLAGFTVLPGQTFDVGEVIFRFAPGAGEVGPGVIAGEVALNGAAGGPRTVRLFRLIDGVMTEIGSVLTDASGAFTFATGTGRFAVAAELNGFTPDYAVDLTVGEGAGEQLAFSLAGPDALRLTPVTAVLVPAVPAVEGVHYVNADAVDVNVLAFGGVTGMRLSTSAALVDAAGTDLPFSTHAATTRVSLPDVQGLITIHAQFEARTSSGFVFLSPTFSVDVVRDTTPPRIEEFAAPSLPPAADGIRYVTGDDDDVGLRVDAFDQHSAIHRVLVAQPADNQVPATGLDAFNVVFSPGGRARVDEVIELSPGEGEKVFFAVVADRAGNVSAPATLRVVRDTRAPTLALGIAEAEGQLLRDRAVTAAFDIAGVAAADLPVLMRVGPSPLSPTQPLQPFASSLPLTLGGAHDDIVIVAAELRDAAGNVALVETAPLRLSLVADMAGSVIVEGIPDLAANSAGTTITLRRGSTVVATTTTASTGAYAFAAVPEGAGYRVEARRPGYVDIDTTLGSIDANTSVDGGVVTMAVARGTLEGRFLRADRLANPTGHGLIIVTATLTGSARAQDFSDFTTEDGAVRFLGVPATLAGESWILAASTEGYARVETPPASVSLATTTIVADQQLAPLNGEFDICAPTGACNPLAFSNLNALRVRLRDAAGVTAIRASVGSAPTGAFAPFDAGTPVLVDVSGVADGNVSVFVQAIVDGVQGVPLESLYVRDTVAPTVTSFERLADAGALDGRFTNDPTVGARLEASAGAGTVSPLVDAHLAFAATPPASPPVTATRCVMGEVCDVPLPAVGGIIEGIHRLFAFACDAAGNCAAPASASVIYDDTPPSALHGVAFTPIGTGVVSFAGGLFTRSSQYPVRIDVGQARTGAGVVVVDDQGTTVRDVFGYRFSLVQAIAAENIASLSTNPAAGGTEIVDGLSLPPTDGLARVFALFVDAAGNTTPVEPNPFSFELTLDTSPPQVAFALDNGASTSTDSVVAVTVTPGAVDPPVRAHFTLDGGTFTTPLTPSPVALPLTGANTTITLPAGDGPRTVHARFFDAAGNVAERAAGITVDASAPVVTLARCASCTINDGAAFTNAVSRVVTIDVAATDVAGAVASIEVGVNGGARSPQPNTGAVSATLQNLTTLQAVQVVAVDVAGNRSAVVSVPITLDVIAPVSAVVVDGVDGTGSLSATLAAADANGVATMRLSTSGVFGGPQLPFSSPVQVDLPGGVRTVNVEVFDRAGNRATSSATLPTAALVVAGGASSTRTSPAPVVLTVPSSPGPVQFVVDDTLLSCATASGYAAAGGTSVSTTVGLDGGDGPKTVSACVRDGLGNTVRVARTITLDTVGPQNAFVFIDGGAPVSLDRDVSVTIAAPADAVQMAVGEGLIDCAAGTTVFTAVAVTEALTFTPGAAPAEGDRTVSVCLRDAAGNTARFTDNILVDTFDPTGTLRVDADGDAFVRSTAVTLFIEDASSDVAAMAFANGALSCAGALFQPFSAGVAFALPAGDSSKTIAGCLRDRAGRITPVQATVTLDTVAPVAAIVVNGGATFATTTSVTATVTGEGAGGTLFAVAVGVLDCAAASFTPFDGSEARALTLAGVDGPKTVSACVRDAAGNTSLASTSIVLDRAPPDALLASCATCLRTGGGAFETNILNHLFEVEAIDDAGAVALTRLSVRAPNGATVVVDQAFGPTANVTLAALDGTHTVTVSFVDGAGLVGDTLVVPILLDSVAPAATLVLTGQAAGGASTSLTRDPNVRITLTGASADIVQLMVSEDAGFVGAAFVPFSAAAQAFVLLSQGDAPKTLNARVRDRVGNETTLGQQVITLDTTPPTNATVLIAGGADRSTVANPSVTFNAVGATQLSIITPDGAAGAGFVTVGFPRTQNVVVEDQTNTVGTADNDGTKTVLGVFRDNAGNETTAIADSIVLDRFAPAPSADIPCPTATQVVCLNDGAQVASSVSVVLRSTSTVATGDALTNATEMQIAIDGNADVEAFIPFAPTQVVLLSGIGAPTKTVAVRFRDAAGNTSGQFTDSIDLDSTPPTVPVLAVTSLVTSATTFALDVTSPSTDVNFLTHEALGAQFPGFTAFVGNSVNLSLPTDGPRVVRVRGVDRAGNVSADVSATITRDTVAPTNPTLFDQASERFVNAGNITLPLATASTDVNFATYQVCAATVPATTCNNAQFVDAPGQTIFTFPLVQNASQSFCVRARDLSVTVPAGDATPGNKSAQACVRVTEDSTPPAAPDLEEAAPLIVGTRTRLFFTANATFGDTNFSHWLLLGTAYSDDTPLCPAVLQPLCTSSDAVRVITRGPAPVAPVAIEVDVVREELNELEVRGVDRAGNVGARTTVAFLEASRTLAAKLATDRSTFEIDAHGHHVVLAESLNGSANSDRARLIGAGDDLTFGTNDDEQTILTTGDNLVDNFSGASAFAAMNRVSIARNTVTWLEKSAGATPKPGVLKMRNIGSDGIYSDAAGDDLLTTLVPTLCGGGLAMRWSPALEPNGASLTFSCQSAEGDGKFDIVRVTPGADGVYDNVGDTQTLLIADPTADDVYPVPMGDSIAYYRATDGTTTPYSAFALRVRSAGADRAFATADDVDVLVDDVVGVASSFSPPPRLGLFLDPDPAAPACQQGVTWVDAQVPTGFANVRNIGMLRTPGADRILGTADDVVQQLPFAESPVNPGFSQVSIARGVITMNGSQTRIVVTPGKNRCFDAVGSGDDEISVEFANVVGTTVAIADGWYELKHVSSSVRELRRHDELRRSPFYWRTTIGESFGSVGIGGDFATFQTRIGNTETGNAIDFGDRLQRITGGVTFSNTRFFSSVSRHARFAVSRGFFVQEPGIDGAVFSADDPPLVTAVPAADFGAPTNLSGERVQGDLAEDLFAAARRSSTDVLLRIYFAGANGLWEGSSDATECNTDIITAAGRRTEVAASGRKVAFLTEATAFNSRTGAISVWENTNASPCTLGANATETTLVAAGFGRPTIQGGRVAVVSTDASGLIGGGGTRGQVTTFTAGSNGLFRSGFTRQDSCVFPARTAWRVPDQNRGAYESGRMIFVATAPSGLTNVVVCDTAGGELSVIDIGNHSGLAVEARGGNATIAGNSFEGFSGGLFLELGR